MNDIDFWVSRIADIFVEGDEPDEDTAENFAVELGCDPELAMLICEYLPSAFGEQFVLKFEGSLEPMYVRTLTDGSEIRCHWDDDVVWLRTQAFVQTCLVPNRWKKFGVIGTISAEFDAINSVNESGSDPRGARFASAFLGRLEPGSPWIPSNAIPLEKPRKLSIFSKLFRKN